VSIISITIVRLLFRYIIIGIQILVVGLIIVSMITSANTYDVQVTDYTVDIIVNKRTSSKPKYNHQKQNLHLRRDKAYNSKM
jgi:hypothetical protein